MSRSYYSFSARDWSLVFDPEKPTFSVSSEHKTTYKLSGSYSLPYSLPSLWKIRKRISQLSPFDHATWQHSRESPWHVRESARVYDVRMAQFVLKIEKLSHIIGARESRNLRSPSPIMAPVKDEFLFVLPFQWLSISRKYTFWLAPNRLWTLLFYYLHELYIFFEPIYFLSAPLFAI